jgi:CRP-like cAMP-binding protein
MSVPADDGAQILAALNASAPLGEEALALALSRLRDRRLAVGERLSAPGSVPGIGGLVAEGVLRESYVDRDGREHTRKLVMPGGLTGTIFDGMPGLTAVAIKRARVWTIEGPDLVALCAESPEWRAFRERVLACHYAKTIEREFRFVSLSPLEHYEHLRQTEPRLEQQVPLYEIASFLRISAEHLSRIRRTLATRKRSAFLMTIKKDAGV